MADVEQAGGNSESKDTVLNVTKLTELVAREVEQVGDEKPTTGEDEKEDDHVIGIIRNYVGNVAEMEGMEGFRHGYIDSISSHFWSYFKRPDTPRGSNTTSMFYKVPKEIRNRPGSEGLYDPTFVDLLELRVLLEIDNNKKDSAWDEINRTGPHQLLRHYYCHLFSILERISPEKSLKDVMQKIYEKREELARCNEPNIAIDFLHLLALLLGGCFVFDTIFRWSPFRVYIQCCHLWASELWVDLLLLDNQIPFFILEIFYAMFYEDHIRYSTEKLVFDFFKDFLPLNKQAFLRRREIEEEPNRVVHHLLHLVHDTLLPDSNDSLETPWWFWFFRPNRKPYRQPEMRAIPTATRLQEVGVQFWPVKEKGFILDFNKGVLKLPHLHVRKNTKKVLMNLIVWEQFCCEPVTAYVSNYTILMDYLVNTSKDIEILINNGVLEHSLAADEEVAGVFNTLGEDLGHTKMGEMFEPNGFILELSNELNDYCENRFNIWRSKLMNEYFGSPWSIISLVAAVFLILFTLLQTFFSVFSYFRPPN
ncbi:hypothetical protein H6P81_016941 [Aristolochia fimbriata]|uniref:Uncharacterized protein n=1 Tax=Aristolochia fimbriata TaxID=158543 RepID=A0AAV7E146_ARIFI|nr:hypothetical protein H6P81_016941 [Aristolochia fimbriata]